MNSEEHLRYEIVGGPIKYGEKAPDITTPVIGYRSWNSTLLQEISRVMVATGMGPLPSEFLQDEKEDKPGLDAWVPGVNVAKCRTHGVLEQQEYLDEMGGKIEGPVHHPPEADCGCGLYAFHTLKQATAPAYGEVVGAIKGWGKIQVANAGFRVEKAEVIALLWCDPKLAGGIEHARVINDKIEEIADAYEVPVLTQKELHEYVRNFGQPVPQELYPKIKDIERAKKLKQQLTRTQPAPRKNSPKPTKSKKVTKKKQEDLAVEKRKEIATLFATPSMFIGPKHYPPVQEKRGGVRLLLYWSAFWLIVYQFIERVI